MKFLKLKSILFSLMAIAMVTVFLSSCEKDKIDLASNESSEKEQIFVYPYGYDKLTIDEKTAYIQSLQIEEFQKLVDSRNIIQYFKSLGKTDILANNLKYGDIVDENTMAKFLTIDQIEAYDQFEPIELRGCCSGWDDTGKIVTRSTCVPFYCACSKLKVQVRDCKQKCWGCLGFCEESRLKYISKC